MEGFLKQVGEIVGLPEQAIIRNLPAPVIFDKPGKGFDASIMKSGILCTARSGSSLLSVAMEAYEFNFKEYLNGGDFLKKVIIGSNVVKTSELAEPFEEAASRDGRLSIKMPVIGLSHLFMMGELPKNISQWRFIYLRRENLVRQAISAFIAQRTGLWTQNMVASGQVSDDDYSFDDILKQVNFAVQGNRSIERFIGLMGLSTYNVVYEEFLKNQKLILAEIAAFLGCDPKKYPDAEKHKPWIEKQSTDLNKRWEDRFREDLLGRLNIDLL